MATDVAAPSRLRRFKAGDGVSCDGVATEYLRRCGVELRNTTLTVQEVKAVRVDSADNLSDTFSKALPRASFEKHRLAIMGPQDEPGK